MDVSWSELLVIGIVALVIIGPKDLPGMFRELGRFTAKIRAMGREFNRAMEQAAKETGVKDIASDLRKVTDPKSMGLDAVRSAADKFEKWDPLKSSAKPAAPLTPPPMPAPAAPVAAAGPATAALAADVAAKRKVSAEKTAAIVKAKAAPAAKAGKGPVGAAVIAPVAEAPAVRRAGRVRKKPDPAQDDAT